MTSRRGLLVVLLIVVGLSSCGGDTGARDGRPLVVATTTILGDLVTQIVGNDASVEVLMPIGADPHDFQASAAQIAAVNRADLVVANGLGLEEGLEDALDSARSDGVVVLEVGPELDPIPFPFREASTDDGHGAEDPHVWFDPIRMSVAARLVGDALQAADPSVEWVSRAEAYAAELEAVDRQISDILSGVSADQRKLVTSHESLGYFAERYDFEVIGVVIPGGSTLSDPSSEDLARLVDVIRSEGVRVIFSETTQSSTLVEAIAGELGEEVAIVAIHTGSLGEPGSGADTLIDMLTTNAERIAGALDG